MKHFFHPKKPCRTCVNVGYELSRKNSSQSAQKTQPFCKETGKLIRHRLDSRIPKGCPRRKELEQKLGKDNVRKLNETIRPSNSPRYRHHNASK